MSTPFNVRSWANQAGIQMSGGFAVVAECVTLDELQAFAQIAIGEYVKSQLHLPQRKPLSDEHPLMVFAKECVLGAYSEKELADAANRAIKYAHSFKGEGMNRDDIIRMAREALENAQDQLAKPYSTDASNAITALREALAEPNKCTHGVTDGSCKECYMAEPEQEPVAWMEMVVANLVREGINKHKARELARHFATPPQRKPLTQEQLHGIREHQRLLEELGPVWAPMLYYFCSAIEAAHGIKGEA